MLKKLVSAVALTLVAALAWMPVALDAQQNAPGAPVTQTGSTGLAAQQCVQVTGTVSTAQTLTIQPPGGSNSVYIDYLVLATGSTGAVTTAATVSTFTSTNIAGTPSFPTSLNQAAAAAVVTAAGATGSLAIPIKGQVGLGPTFVGPTANAAVFDVMTACYHVAP